MRTILLQTLGYGFLALGVLGLFVPILQGFLFLAIGLILLAKHARWARRLLDHFRERHPKGGRLIQAAEDRVAAWGHKAASWFRRVFGGAS